MQPAAAPRARPRASRRSPLWTSQPSRIQSGAGRWSATRTSQAGIAQQPAHHGGADRAGAAGHQHPAHRERVGLARLLRGGAPSSAARLGGVGEHLRRCPSAFQGSTSRQSSAALRRGSRAAPPGPSNSEWLVATITTSAPSTASASGCVGVARVRIAHRHVGQLALEQPDQLRRERVALVVGVALEGEPEHRDLASSDSAPEPPLDPLDEEQRHRLVDAGDGQQHPGGVRALLGEGEVLAQAGPGGHARHRDPAARIVAVDQVDHLEHVGAVALAVHHQQVRQRERRVAQDVRPDLGQLGLHRGGPDDRRAEHAEQLGRALGGGLADAADDARQRGDLLQEAPGGDPLRGVGDEHVLADPQVAALLDVAGDELGRARGDRRAQDQRVAGAQERAAGRRPPRGPGAGRSRRARTTACRS